MNMTIKLRWYGIKKSRWDRNIKKYRAFDQNDKHMVSVRIDDRNYTKCSGTWFVVADSCPWFVVADYSLGSFRTAEAAMKVAEDFVITREMEKYNAVQSKK